MSCVKEDFTCDIVTGRIAYRSEFSERETCAYQQSG